MRRGEIYLIDFEPSVGAEIRKKRPALIISCDEANKHLKTIMVIPFSSRTERVYPFEVLVEKEDSGLEANSKLKIPQMRAVEKAWLNNAQFKSVAVFLIFERQNRNKTLEKIF